MILICLSILELVNNEYTTNVLFLNLILYFHPKNTPSVLKIPAEFRENKFLVFTVSRCTLGINYNNQRYRIDSYVLFEIFILLNVPREIRIFVLKEFISYYFRLWRFTFMEM